MKRLFGILLWALFCLFGTQLSFGQNNREQVLALQRQAIELMDNGDPDQGIVLLRQALTLDPDYWPLTYEMAYAYMVKRDYQKAGSNAFPIRALFIWSRGSFRECRGITTKRSLLSKKASA